MSPKITTLREESPKIHSYERWAPASNATAKFRWAFRGRLAFETYFPLFLDAAGPAVVYHRRIDQSLLVRHAQNKRRPRNFQESAENCDNKSQ